MNKKIVISNNGIDIFKFNEKLGELYKIFERDNEWRVYLKEGKKLISVHNTEQEAYSFLWEKSEFVNYRDLTYPVIIDMPVKLTNLINHLTNIDIIDVLISQLYPSFNKLILGNRDGKENITVLGFDYEIDNDDNYLRCFPREIVDWHSGTQIAISNYKRILTSNHETLADAEDYNKISLLELIKLLFNEFQSNNTCKITKVGIEDIINRCYIVNPIGALFNPCEIENNVKLLDIFNICMINEDVRVFLKDYIGFEIDEYYKLVKESKAEPEFDLINLNLNLFYYENMLLEIGCQAEGKIADHNEKYDIEFVPVAGLANCPVKLNQEIEFNINEKTFNLKYKYNLLEILSGLFDEIGFHWTPENQKEAIKELLELEPNRIKLDMEKLRSMETLQEELKKEEQEEEDGYK